MRFDHDGFVWVVELHSKDGDISLYDVALFFNQVSVYSCLISLIDVDEDELTTLVVRALKPSMTYVQERASEVE